jgi:hypothetical protein
MTVAPSNVCSARRLHDPERGETPGTDCLYFKPTW